MCIINKIYYIAHVLYYSNTYLFEIRFVYELFLNESNPISSILT